MRRSGNEAGFTIIELLVVIVILGILAAVAMQRFGATKGKAFDASAKTDLRNAMTAQEAHYSDYLTYADDVADLDFDGSANVTTTVESGDAAGYELTAKHSESATTWCVNSSDGIVVAASDC